MKRSIFLLLVTVMVTLFSCTATKPPVNDEGNTFIFMWDKDVSITWNDYKGPIDKETKWAAVTVSFLAYQVISKHEVRITACFNRDQSWAVPERTREDLLKHEQYHFNITEVCAREMRKKILREKVIAKSQTFMDIYAGQTKLCNEMQSDYDQITQHGQNKEQQALQEKLIDAKLKALEEFANPTITY